MKSSMGDVVPFFDAGRMADEYYQKLYNFDGPLVPHEKLKAAYAKH